MILFPIILLKYYLRGDFMSNLNLLELQNLRHLIGAHETIANKLDDYANQCTDQQLVQMLKNDAQEARNSKQNLMSFLK